MRSMGIAVLALLLFSIVACSGPASEAPLTPSGETVVLTSSPMGKYSPAEIRVKAGSTVRIEGDPETLVDGMDTVVIEAYGINKRITPDDNIVEFVADKPGTFEMRCANGMGDGKLIVEA